MRAAIATAWLLLGCVSSEWELGPNHPANPSAPTAPIHGAPLHAAPLQTAPHSSNAGALGSEFDALAVPEASHVHPTNEASDEPPSEATRYTCPMHPEVIKAEPGNCPICGMKLVPMKEKAQEAAP